MKIEDGRYGLQITKRYFMIYAAPMWNKLPLVMRSDPPISLFRKKTEETSFIIIIF